ncbi:MAG: hypothetical protein ACYTEG_01495 [Planctomycetota bacterium]|jgi:hypothetical protein
MSRPIAFTLMAAIALTAFFAGRMSQSKSDERAEVARSPSAEEQDSHVTREAYDALRVKLTEARRVIESQKRELVETAAAKPEPEPEAAPAIEAESGSAPRFVFKGQEDMLKSIDWKVMGEALNAMPALLHELREAMSASPIDRPRLLEVSGKIQRWNGPLLSQAAQMEKANLSGTGTNGIWTHPILVVNQVYATLAVSEHKMTEAQIPQLQQIGDRFREAEARRVAAETDAMFGVEKVLAETALRDELFTAIDGMLTPEQQDVLHPEESRGYTTADMFSSAILWNTLIHPVQFSARSDLAMQIANVVIANEKVPAPHHDAVRAVVTEWTNALPDALLTEPQTAAVGIRIMRVAHITQCAKQVLKLRKELANRVPDDGFQARMKGGKGVIVWFKT